MVSGKQKSRSKRRILRRTPSGRIAMHYLKRKPNKAHCPSCGAILAGVPAARNVFFSNLAKTKKRPQRMFGGQLCSSCSRRAIIARFRK